MATASTLILASPTPTPSVIVASSRWSFTQGFLVGQATFLVLCGLFIKYVVFEDAERSRQRTAERAKVRRCTFFYKLHLLYNSIHVTESRPLYYQRPTAVVLQAPRQDRLRNGDARLGIRRLDQRPLCAGTLALLPNQDMETNPGLWQVLQGYRDDLLGSGGEEGARKQVETWLNPKGTTSNWLVSSLPF